MPLILDRQTVAELFPMPLAIQSARDAFAALASGRATMPQRTALRLPNGDSHLVMPCHAPGSLSLKAVGVFNDNPARGLPAILGCLLLFDESTGALLALMDAEHLTAMRTGAASALATDYLARQDAKTLALIGAGGQAAAQIEAILAVRPVERILVAGRDPARTQAFCEAHGKNLQPSEAEEAVRQSDIVCCATNSSTPVIKREWLRPGTHINAIGVFRPDMAEVDAATVTTSRVFVDHIEAAQNGAGDLIQANDLDWSQVKTLGELVLGQAQRRTDDDEITLFKSVGTAVQDAVAAKLIYDEAIRQGKGTHFEL